jgi:hypothetical protein
MLVQETHLSMQGANILAAAIYCFFAYFAQTPRKARLQNQGFPYAREARASPCSANYVVSRATVVRYCGIRWHAGGIYVTRLTYNGARVR